jgi:hypothetical protein
VERFPVGHRDDPNGQPVLTIDLGSEQTTYRAVPISSSELTLSQLESAMNTMYGTPSTVTTGVRRRSR